MICNNSPYGNFRTRTFANIFEEEDVFNQTLKECGVPLKITEESLSTLFYLLYARYGNSHIASYDENQFIYKVASTIFMYGPTWEKRIEIQDKLRDLSLEDGSDIFKGSQAIYNSANAPGTSLADNVGPDGKVDYISGQNTTDYRKSKLEGYATLASLLETDVTKEFLDKFANLFLKIVEPYSPLWYVTEVEE